MLILQVQLTADLCFVSIYLCEGNINKVDISRCNTSWPTLKETGCEILLHIVLYLFIVLL